MSLCQKTSPCKGGGGGLTTGTPGDRGQAHAQELRTSAKQRATWAKLAAYPISGQILVRHGRFFS
jgi:hypothetical protein